MGKCETSTASIGIKILLSDIILQIDETNIDLIKEMLDEGFIEDENEYFNEVYTKITDDLTVNYLDIKEYLINECKNKGSYFKQRFGGDVSENLDDGCLFDKELIVPLKEILTTCRWGYDRYGANCISRPIDFDLSVNIAKYKEIKNTKIVFLLTQISG